MSEIASWLPLRERWQKANPQKRQQILSEFSDAEVDAVNWWTVQFARDNQLPPPGDWVYWVILAGRGFGKTRAGAELVRLWARTERLVNLIGATADDARDIMIEGESGILAICPKAERPIYKKSDRALEWPNGGKSLIFTADEPDRLRGKQHLKLWMDELCSWRYVEESFDQAMLGLRLGRYPQAVITTTPRPLKQLKTLLNDPATVVTRGSTYDNKQNLAQVFFDKITTRYENTRLGRQELNAEILDDIEGALWTNAMLDKNRVQKLPEMRRIVIGIDPAVSANKASNETGIIGTGQGVDREFYPLADVSGIYSPLEWAMKAIYLYNKLQADAIICEVNNGGDLVEANLRAAGYKGRVINVHASKGKSTRAEPVVGMYEQGKVHHLGHLAGLESQMVTWDPKTEESPDRVDALVWSMTELMDGVSSWDDILDLGRVEDYSNPWR